MCYAQHLLITLQSINISIIFVLKLEIHDNQWSINKNPEIKHMGRDMKFMTKESRAYNGAW